MGAYKLQICTPDLRDKVSQYFVRHLGFTHPRIDHYLDWAHDQNPYFKESLIYLALHENEVVGLRSAIGTCWETEDGLQQVMLPDIKNSSLAKEHRDGGLYKELSEFTIHDLTQRNYPCALNLSPNPPNYVVSVMTMGWKPLGSSETMSRIIPHHPVAAGRAMRFAVRAGRKLKSVTKQNLFADLDRNIRHSKLPLTVSDQSRPHEMEALIQEIGSNGKIRHIRNAEYFTWRFQNPFSRFRFLFWGDNEQEGYLVLHNMLGLKNVAIVQWEGKNPEIRSGLLDAAITMGKFNDLEIWGASLSQSYRNMLQQFDFVYNNDSPTSYQRQNFMIKPLGEAKESLTLLGQDPGIHDNWNFQTVFWE